MGDVAKELREIGRMLSAADAVLEVRREVSRVMSGGFAVMDGRHHESGRGFDVVVACGASQPEVARRLRSAIPDGRVEEIAAGLLGIKTARRVHRESRSNCGGS